ncbi:hypothetical protein PPUN110474_25750 [Pseudomonas putida]|nr:hypothetical protein PPUN110474_25750 [Pseudomonas putida]
MTGWEAKRFFPFEHPRRTMEGLGSVAQPPTRGYLINGALYKNNASFWLSDRPNGLPRIVV